MLGRVLCTSHYSQKCRPPCIGYQSKGGTLHTSAHCIFLSALARKTIQSSTGWNNSLLTERRQSKISFSGGCQSPLASESLLVAGCRAVHLCTPFWCHSGRNPVPCPRSTDATVRLAICHLTHTLSAETKRAHIQSETKKDIPTQGDKLGTGCVDLYLLVRRCSRPKAHSHAAGGDGKTTCRRLPLDIFRCQQSKYWKREETLHIFIMDLKYLKQ